MGHEEFEQLVGVWRVPLNSSAPEGFTYSSPDSQVFPMRKKAG